MGKEVYSGPGSRDPGDICWMSEKVKEREDSMEHPPSSFLGGSVTLEMGSVRTDELLSRNKQEHFFLKDITLSASRRNMLPIIINILSLCEHPNYSLRCEPPR